MAGALLTTGRENYNTPEDIVAEVKAFYGGTIDLDPCSNDTSIVGAIESITFPENGLHATWFGKKVYVNPPFKNTAAIQFWTKGVEQLWPTETVYLLPVKPDTALWQDHILPQAEAICFYRGRITFLNMNAPILQPCALIYLGHRKEEFIQHFSRLGVCVDCSTLSFPADTEAVTH